MADEKYHPSPSKLGSCQRRLAYEALGHEGEKNPLHTLRAERGSAIHGMIETIISYVIKHDPLLENVVGWEPLEKELSVTFPEESGIEKGTLDLWAVLYYEIGSKEVVFDLKNYKKIPELPYESNVLQLQAYMEALNESVDCGYIIYFPDSGEPKAFKVERDPDIFEYSAKFFAEVQRAVDEPGYLPARLDFHDVKCSYCQHWNECWGQMLSDIPADKLKGGIPLIEDKDMSDNITTLFEVRKKKGDLRVLEDRMFDAIVKRMQGYNLYKLKTPNGISVELKFIKKGVGGYYSIKEIKGE